MSLDRVAFGYRRNAKFEDYLSFEELITTVIQTVAYGGTFLIKVVLNYFTTLTYIRKYPDQYRSRTRWNH